MQDYESTQHHVYMVDTHANFPPVPRRSAPSKPLPPPPSPYPGARPPCAARWGQTLGALLLLLMLCGLAVQAVFLYRLYHPTAAADSPSTSKLTDGGGCAPPPTTAPPADVSKPVAHLTCNGYNYRLGREVLSWATASDRVLHKMKYKDGELVVKEEGFYFIYSKVFFMARASFDHTVFLKTRTYQHEYIEILKARRICPHSNPKPNPTPTSNSYLGGVFHLRKGDSIFVNTSSKIIHSIPSENVFGAFMI